MRALGILGLFAALSLGACAQVPQVAPRFEQPSTTGIKMGIAVAHQKVTDAKVKATKIVTDAKEPSIKLQAAALVVVLDSALTALDTTEAARKTLEAQLKVQTDKANGLADKYDKAQAEIKSRDAIIDEVNSHWGLGAFAYGFRVLTRHLLILAAVIAVGLVAIWGISLAFPVVGAGVSIGSAFIRAALVRLLTAWRDRKQ